MAQDLGEEKNNDPGIHVDENKHPKTFGLIVNFPSNICILAQNYKYVHVTVFPDIPLQPDSLPPPAPTHTHTLSRGVL